MKQITPLLLLPQKLFWLQSLSVQKPNITISNFQIEDKGSYLEQTQFPCCRNSHQQIVQGSWFLVKEKTGNFSFFKTAPVAKLLSWQLHLGFHWASFVMGIYGANSFRNNALVFPEISFIQFLKFFTCNIVTSSLI